MLIFRLRDIFLNYNFTGLNTHIYFSIKLIYVLDLYSTQLRSILHFKLKLVTNVMHLKKEYYFYIDENNFNFINQYLYALNSLNIANNSSNILRKGSSIIGVIKWGKKV